MNKQHAIFRITRRRAGSIYVFVLGISTLVAVIGLSVLTLAQLNARAASGGNDSAEAAILAQSAVEFAQLKLASNANWRTTYTNGVATSPVALGRGTISFMLVDPNDGDLTNNSSDSVQIYGIGKVGSATRACSVVSGVYYPPLSSLSSALGVPNGITINSGTLTGSGTLATNSSIGGLGNTGAINLEAGGLVTGSFTGTGTVTSGATLRSYPDTTSVFSYYSTNGRSVSYSSIPTVNGSKTISKALFSPNSNPYGGGAVNSQGIYVINCGNSALTITNTRVVGTLVILNVSTLTVSGSNSFEPSLPGFPVLLVQGSLTLSGSATALSESSISTNLNPSGTPYPYNGGAGGTSNTTTTDTYPSAFNGIVYCTGFLTTSGSTTNTIKGVLIGNNIASLGGTLNINFDPTSNTSPPPGFTSAAQLNINTGSWEWDQAP